MMQPNFPEGGWTLAWCWGLVSEFLGFFFFLWRFCLAYYTVSVSTHKFSHFSWSHSLLQSEGGQWVSGCVELGCPLGFKSQQCSIAPRKIKNCVWMGLRTQNFSVACFNFKGQLLDMFRSTGWPSGIFNINCWDQWITVIDIHFGELLYQFEIFPTSS